MAPSPLRGLMPSMPDLDVIPLAACLVDVGSMRILARNAALVGRFGELTMLAELLPDAQQRTALLADCQRAGRGAPREVRTDAHGGLRLAACQHGPGVLMVLAHTDGSRATDDLQALLGLVADVEWEWDMATGATRYRGTGLALANYARADLPTTMAGVAEFVHAQDMPAVQTRLAAFLRAPADALVVEFRLRMADDTYRWVLARGRVVEQTVDGRVQRVVGILTDIHEHRVAEQQRDRLEAQLRHMQKLDALGQLTGGIAHDFNNILASVMGYAELGLLDGPDAAGTAGGPLREYFSEIRRAADRGRELIGTLLLFSRGGQSQGQRLDVGPLVDDVVRMLRPMLPATLQLDTDVDPGAPDVSVDPIQLQQLVLNLAINARDAVGENGILGISVAARDCRGAQCASCKGVIDGKHTAIVVQDNGQGIHPDDLDSIFDPFFTTKEASRGSGLGLSVVHGIVHEHGGHVLLQTEPGVGTRFTLLLPAIDGPRPRQSAPLADAMPRPGAGARIMVVEDEAAVAQAIGGLLERHGYRVEVFTDPLAALRAFGERPGDFALVLTDQAMPDLSGIELADEMLVLRPELPIVVCTGYSEFVDGANARDLGFAGFLGKPVSARELLLQLETLLPEACEPAVRVPSPTRFE